MVKDMKPEDREKFDAALQARPTTPAQPGELRPPSWWHGEEEASRLAAEFGAALSRQGR